MIFIVSGGGGVLCECSVVMMVCCRVWVSILLFGKRWVRELVSVVNCLFRFVR